MNNYKAGRFLVHLGRVTKAYREREKARQSLARQLKHDKRDGNKFEVINCKLDALLKKEMTVLSMGVRKHTAPVLRQRLDESNAELKLVHEECIGLREENEELKKLLDFYEKKFEVDDVKEAIVEKENSELLHQLRQKLMLAEKNLKKIEKKKGVSKQKVSIIKRRIKKYKAEIKLKVLGH